MSPSRAFMTARWEHVLGVTWAADEALLEPHLPRGAQIDVLEGSSRVSIVAFRFRRTRLRGVPIPLHVNFGEINLRFYVATERPPRGRLHPRVRLAAGDLARRQAGLQRARPDDPHA